MTNSVYVRKDGDGFRGFVHNRRSGDLFRTEIFATAAAAYKDATRERDAIAAARKAAHPSRNSDRMTCQCCGKRYLANTGVIAHHGYQRPGGGWQTASCAGARYVPFEVSRLELHHLIVGLRDWKKRAIESRSAVDAETQAAILTITDRSQPRDMRGHRSEKTISVTRATFDEVRAEHQDTFRSYGWHNFDAVKNRDLSHRDSQIKGVTAEISAQQARYDGWAQTHEWSAAAKIWSPLAKGG